MAWGGGGGMMGGGGMGGGGGGGMGRPGNPGGGLPFAGHPAGDADSGSRSSCADEPDWPTPDEHVLAPDDAERRQPAPHAPAARGGCSCIAACSS